MPLLLEPNSSFGTSIQRVQSEINEKLNWIQKKTALHEQGGENFRPSVPRG